jgi:hypothetical protein
MRGVGPNIGSFNQESPTLTNEPTPSAETQCFFSNSCSVSTVSAVLSSLLENEKTQKHLQNSKLTKNMRHLIFRSPFPSHSRAFSLDRRPPRARRTRLLEEGGLRGAMEIQSVEVSPLSSMHLRVDSTVSSKTLPWATLVSNMLGPFSPPLAGGPLRYPEYLADRGCQARPPNQDVSPQEKGSSFQDYKAQSPLRPEDSLRLNQYARGLTCHLFQDYK